MFEVVEEKGNKFVMLKVSYNSIWGLKLSKQKVKLVLQHVEELKQFYYDN